jgi:hypothetical protein
MVRRVAVRVVHTARIPTRAADQTAASNDLGEALRVPCSAPLNPVRPAGALGSWVRAFPSGRVQPPSSGEAAGGARFADKERQRSETPVGLSQPTAQMVLTRVALAATSEPFGARP